MYESIRSVILLFVLIGGAGACIGIAWTATLSPFEDHTGGYKFISVFIAIFVASLLLFFLFTRRRDVVPDYLRSAFHTYFNCDGFCFIPSVSVTDGICYLSAAFSNQYERPCIGRIYLRPPRESFKLHSGLMYTLEIPCAEAGYGTAQIAIPVPENLQGQKIRFEIGASVRYSEGRGRKLRFHRGLSVRSSTDPFSPVQPVTILAFFAGALVFVSPAKATLSIPTGVATELPNVKRPEVHLRWKLGDLQDAPSSS